MGGWIMLSSKLAGRHFAQTESSMIAEIHTIWDMEYPCKAESSHGSMGSKVFILPYFQTILSFNFFPYQSSQLVKHYMIQHTKSRVGATTEAGLVEMNSAEFHTPRVWLKSKAKNKPPLL